jgi:hypothetical protein
MGSSNGAALVNQIAIETKLIGIKNYISVVSPLIKEDDILKFLAGSR